MNSNYFQTITQFINTEDEEYNKKKYNKNACHFFALKTAKEFFKKKDLSKTCHEANIYYAINMNKLYDNHDMFFEDVIKFTDLKQNDIMATSTELIETGEYPLDIIFPDTTKSYCLIILKNSKFFNVMHYDGKYYIRDCHEPFQYDFNSKNEMINHLNEIYQFNKSIVVDGYAIPEFSSIEYIFIDKDFKLNLMDDENEKKSIEKKDELKETEFGIFIGKMDYEELVSGNDKVKNHQENNTNEKNSKTPEKNLQNWVNTLKKNNYDYNSDKKYPDEDLDDNTKSDNEDYLVKYDNEDEFNNHLKEMDEHNNNKKLLYEKIDKDLNEKNKEKLNEINKNTNVMFESEYLSKIDSLVKEKIKNEDNTKFEKIVKNYVEEKINSLEYKDSNYKKIYDEIIDNVIHKDENLKKQYAEMMKKEIMDELKKKDIDIAQGYLQLKSFIDAVNSGEDLEKFVQS
jgi:hypothetical protein